MANACEQCRRVGDKLTLKGERCFSAHCAMIKRPYGPGAAPKTDNRSKKSEYGRQLQEKQKAKAIYGIRERQFRTYVNRAEKIAGNTAENLLRLLELRLDNIVFRLGIAVSRPAARQMVSHGLVRINGQKVNIPSCLVKEGDIIEPKNKSKYKEIKANNVVSWLSLDTKKVSGAVVQIPVREQIDTPINESLIIEFYSR